MDSESITDMVGDLCVCLVRDLAHDVAALRGAAAEALAALLTTHHHHIPSTLDLVLDLYTDHLKVISVPFVLSTCIVTPVFRRHVHFEVFDVLHRWSVAPPKTKNFTQFWNTNTPQSISLARFSRNF